MLTAATGFDHHFSSLVASLALFEAAALDFPGFVPKEGVLDRPGASDELADAFRRGAACNGDISTIDFPFQVSGFRFQVSGFRFQASAFSLPLLF